MFCVISAVLLFGNIKFQDINQEGVDVTSADLAILTR